jgi:flavorubredoxin
MSRVEQIADDILVLSDVIPIDGRVSWLTPRAKGFEPYNEYLVLSADNALLFETGVAVHGPSLVQSLKEILGSRRLAVYPSRIELDSIGNLGRILEEIPNTIVGCANPIEPTRLAHLRDWTTPRAPFTRFPVGSTLAEIGFPQLSVVDPVIRTLGTSWLWHEHAKALFSADFFCNDMLAKQDQSVIRRSGDALIAPEGLRASIHQKFDWLGLASTEKLLPAWDNLFARISPAVLAPVHGRVQFGAKLVAEVLADYRKALFFAEPATAGKPALAQGVSG